MRKTKQEPQKSQHTPDRTREYIAYGVAILSLWFSLEYAIAGYRAHEQARLLREYVDRKLSTPCRGAGRGGAVVSYIRPDRSSC